LSNGTVELMYEVSDGLIRGEAKIASSLIH